MNLTNVGLHKRFREVQV